MLKTIANLLNRNGRTAERSTDAPRGGRGRRFVVAKFDSAQTSPDNRKHWANADGLSPNAAVNPEVRRILRNRARYEVANNSYAKGIALTLANDTIGTGPRLQMLTDDAEANARIEDAFEAWARAVDLPGKLRTMRMARAESGEAFRADRPGQLRGIPDITPALPLQRFEPKPSRRLTGSSPFGGSAPASTWTSNPRRSVTAGTLRGPNSKCSAPAARRRRRSMPPTRA